MYPLEKHYSSSIKTYNVGFTIQVVIYITSGFTQPAFAYPPTRIPVQKGSTTTYGYIEITDTAFVFDFSDMTNAIRGVKMIAFGQ